METNKNYSYQNVIQLDDERSSSRKFLAGVFTWMFAALLISSALAYVFATNFEMRSLISDPITHKMTGLGTLAMFSPLAFVFIMSFGINRLSYPALAGIFLLYAAVTGISLSGILLLFNIQSVVGVFIAATALFAVMAIAGYTTSTDLTGFGSLMVMGLIGLVIASLVNMFLKSPGFDYVLSFFGVAIFTGLTAYDVQKLKRIGEGVEYGDANSKKLALMGALSLYLDFVNLFLYLLRIFGSRRD